MYRTKQSICFPSRRTWTASNGTSFLLQIPTGELFLPWSDETELLCLYDDNKDDDVDVKDDVDDNDDDDGRSQVWVHAQQRQNVEEEHGGFCNHEDNLNLFFPITSFPNQPQTPTWSSVWNFHFRLQTLVQPVLESIWIETFLKGNFRWRCQLNSIARYGDRYRVSKRIYIYCADTRLDDTNNVGALSEK